MREILQFTADTSAPRRARSFLREQLPELPPAVLLEVQLVADELVTNAVCHNGGGELLVCLEPGTIRLEVRDGTADEPVVMHPSATAEGGRGMAIVAALSNRWGTERLDAGKVVWSEFDLPAGAPAA